MAVSFSNKNIPTRSASFPPKSNPMVKKIEDELKNLAKSEELCTSELETISIGLSGLARMYKCVDQALKLRNTQQTLIPKYVDSLVAVTSKLVDICSASKQMLETLRKAVTNVQSTLQNDCSSADIDSMSDYLRARRETIKSAKGTAVSLRQLEIEAARDLEGYELSEVSRVLTCVTIINVSVLESLFRVLMTKPAKRSLFCKLGLTKKTSGKAATLPAKYGNKLSDVDVALLAVFPFLKHVDADTLAVALKRLESMEMSLLELEDGLGFIISVLSKSRASLIKIIST
ncbi:hypothetical protein RND81_09G203800 [Saponaria officinalis]|uniref:Uncharacterized protein n=1 Tax=Saponaria officinalis TaxID=3572 RepID=A0AAW1IQE6_SAPOF